MWIGWEKRTFGNYFSVYRKSLNCFKIDSKEDYCNLTIKKRKKAQRNIFFTFCQGQGISLGTQLIKKTLFSKVIQRMETLLNQNSPSSKNQESQDQHPCFDCEHAGLPRSQTRRQQQTAPPPPRPGSSKYLLHELIK